MLTIRKDLARVKQVGKDCLVVFRWALIFKLAMLGLQVQTNTYYATFLKDEGSALVHPKEV